MIMPISSIETPVVDVASMVSPTSSTSVRNLIGGAWQTLPINSSSSSSEAAMVSPVASTSTSVHNLTGGEWRPLSFITSSPSSTLERGSLAGDFRSLHSSMWNGVIFARFGSVVPQVAAFLNFILDLEKQLSVYAIHKHISPQVSEAFDKCFTLIKVGREACHHWTIGSFPSFRIKFLSVFDTFLDELVNTMNT
jgi:hypothetical protein